MAFLAVPMSAVYGVVGLSTHTIENYNTSKADLNAVAKLNAPVKHSQETNMSTHTIETCARPRLLHIPKP